MKRYWTSRRVMSAVVLATVLPACTFSRMTQLNSDPQGAEVYYKTQIKGTTPAEMKMPCVGLGGGGDPLASFGDSVVELRKPGYRTMKAVVDGNWQWNNVVFGGVVGILLWGKCPDDSYNYKLHRGSADLDDKATLTVLAMPAKAEVYVSGSLLRRGDRVTLDTADPILVVVRSSGTQVNHGILELEPGVDYVTTLRFVPRPRS